ncbi:MAG: formate dehydrogenase family accessory protein FdhD [Spirochaetes bacterium RBG_13_51_14]|nr:MAG: formate dehydrogenase family accessory protein FdhD [Spirochaetes bacterium RBG_13_51_14]
MLQKIITVKAHRYTPAGIEPADLSVSAEYNVTLLLNGRPCLSVACSGSDLDMLAAGHLLSEGIILSKDEIDRIEVNEERMTVNVIFAAGTDVFGRLIKIRTLVSGCAGSGSGPDGGKPASGELPFLNPAVIVSSMKEFLGLSEMYRLTHGVHSAALYDILGKRLAFYDEIGRHNAVDKLLGFALTYGVAMGQAMLLSTGRISSEIVLKASAAGIPAIVTRAAPTSMAVELVRKLNIILITGVKKDAFFIHHGAEYIR